MRPTLFIICICVVASAYSSSSASPEVNPGRALDFTTTASAALEGPVLDLALSGDDRLVVLTPDTLDLYRQHGAELALDARLPLPAPMTTVRAPAGMILLVESDSTAWVLTNRAPRALLLDLDGGRLVWRDEAGVIPWPGSERGLRYREGTNLIEGPLPRLGDGPFLLVRPGTPELAVTAEGRLRLATPDGGRDLREIRVGPTVALVGNAPYTLAASTALPPAVEDAILLLSQEGEVLRVAQSQPVSGAVRALASRRRGNTLRLVAALQDPEGRFRLQAFQLRVPTQW